MLGCARYFPSGLPDSLEPKKGYNSMTRITNTISSPSIPSQQVGILLSLSKIARAHFLNLVFFLRTMKTRILSGFF